MSRRRRPRVLGQGGVRRRRAGAAGATLVEVLIAASVLLVIFGTTFAFMTTVGRAQDRRQLESGLSNGGRVSTDEVLFQLRAASAVVPSQALAGASYTTSASGVVFAAPGYDPADAGVILPGVTDYVAFTYDASAKELHETIAPAASSLRPQRTQLRIARNVAGVAFTYRVREQFKSVGLLTYALKTSASAAPAAFVNGAPVTCTWSAAAPGSVSVASAPVGADVQFVYPVNPAANSGAGLQHVNQVDVTLTLSDTDGRNIARTVTLSGSARLRNQRS